MQAVSLNRGFSIFQPSPLRLQIQQRPGLRYNSSYQSLSDPVLVEKYKISQGRSLAGADVAYRYIFPIAGKVFSGIIDVGIFQNDSALPTSIFLQRGPSVLIV
jgi:hypothetical protein